MRGTWDTAVMSDQQHRRIPTDLGPTGETVRSNVRRLRMNSGLSAVALAQLLTDHGRPHSQNSISRIETGKKRVDVDDLVALAVVLGVAPTTLLLPPTAEGRTELTGAGEVSAHDAWRWADGQWPLKASREPEALRRDLMEFHLRARPEGIAPYQEVEGAVRWMGQFRETPFERNHDVPGYSEEAGEGAGGRPGDSTKGD